MFGIFFRERHSCLIGIGLDHYAVSVHGVCAHLVGECFTYSGILVLDGI